MDTGLSWLASLYKIWFRIPRLSINVSWKPDLSKISKIKASLNF
jgi:hypothetical protein